MAYVRRRLHLFEKLFQDQRVATANLTVNRQLWAEGVSPKELGVKTMLSKVSLPDGRWWYQDVRTNLRHD